MLILSQTVVDLIRDGQQTAVLKDSDKCRWNVGKVHKVFHRFPMGTMAEPAIRLHILATEKISLGDIDNATALKLGFADLDGFVENWMKTHRSTFYRELPVWIIDIEPANGD